MSNCPARKSSFERPSLFGETQPDLFAGALPRSDVFVPNPAHVRNAARDTHEKLQKLDLWASINPTERGSLVRKVSYYYRITADDAEAEEWRRLYMAELAQLHAAGPSAPPEQAETYPHYKGVPEPEWVRCPPGRPLPPQ